MKLQGLFFVLAASFVCLPVSGQTTANVFHPGDGSPVQVFPTVRPMRWMPDRSAPIRVESVDVEVSIDKQTAVTTMEVVLFNPNPRQQEAEILLPVPNGAALRSFDLDGVEGHLPGKLLPRDEARRIYDSIVRRVEDPGLLEFAADGLLRSSVFPVPANGTASVTITYEQWLQRDGNRVDYILPRSEALEYEIPWSFSLVWKADDGVDGIFSPSHEFESETKPDGSITLHAKGKLQSGAIRVSALLADESPQDLTASIFTYPEERGEDGYFLLVFQAPSTPPTPSIPREITFVFDRSGSMAGEKIDQTRAAALQVLETLNPGDLFNFITYNEGVRSLFSAPAQVNSDTLQEAREFILTTRVSGGTNINEALQTALTGKPDPARFPAVLFLTDGIPTIGETRERAIIEAIEKHNVGKRRIFSFGVGLDLNTPLLARIAEETGGKDSIILPREDVELPVAGLAKRLQGVLAVNPDLRFAAPARVDDILPRRVPDLFAGDQVLVLGRYRGDAPIDIRLQTTAANGDQRDWAVRVTLDPKKATTVNAFVPRLWATRKIGVLTSALRDLGASSDQLPNDPRTRELVNEIVRLSLAHGILTEYTAFLAAEEAPINAAAPANQREARHRLEERALQARAGSEAINQELNRIQQRDSAVVKKNNSHYDARLGEVTESRVQQIADKSFLLRSGVWQDAAADSTATAQDVRIGTLEFDALVDRLVASNRQSILSLPGEILFTEGGQTYRIRSATN